MVDTIITHCKCIYNNEFYQMYSLLRDAFARIERLEGTGSLRWLIYSMQFV